MMPASLSTAGLREPAAMLFIMPSTASRGRMRFGDAWPQRHDLSTLSLLGSVREPINPEAWRWSGEVGDGT